jgi:hypothetical protein
MEVDALPFPAMRARVRRMAQADDDPPTAPVEPAAPRSRWLIAAAIFAALFVLALAGAWLERERIAADVISGQFQTYGLPARYTIDSIGPNRQILRNVVVGDPAR